MDAIKAARSERTGTRIYIVPNWDMYLFCTFFVPLVFHTGGYFRKYRLIGDSMGMHRSISHTRQFLV